MQWTTSKADRFRTTYDTVYPILIRVTFRIAGSMEVAEEICQEAFIKFYERVDAFPDADQAKYWLIRVAKNLALNAAKRVLRERRAYERAYHEPHAEAVDGESTVMRAEVAAEVQEALQALPERLRSVLVLKEYGELSYREIGSILGITEGNVKVRVFRARERLATLLLEDGNADG